MYVYTPRRVTPGFTQVTTRIALEFTTIAVSNVSAQEVQRHPRVYRIRATWHGLHGRTRSRVKHEHGISFCFSLLVGCATETDEGLRSAVDDVAAAAGWGSGGSSRGAFRSSA